ncbi:ATP-grasp domain-containing protein [Chitinimonas naiadis]
MSHLVFIESTRAGIQMFDIARRLGVRTTLLTSGKFDWLYPPADRQRLHALADQVITIADTQCVDDIAMALRRCHTQHPVSAVLSTLQMCTLPAAEAARLAGLRGTRVEGIRNARDKPQCRRLLAAIGIPSVAHAVVRDTQQALAELEHIGYPAIIKPITGLGKCLTTIVHKPEDVAPHFDQAVAGHSALASGLQQDVGLEFLVESLAEGPLYSIEVGIGDHDEWMPLAIVRRKTARHNPVLELGSTMPSGLSDAQQQEAADYARRVAQALGLGIGLFHVEFIYTAQGPRLVEVNPRIAGGSIPDLIHTATGVNLFEVLLRIFLGERLGLNQLPTHIACSQTYLCALKDCTIREDLPIDWLDRFRSRNVAGRTEIWAGRRLKAHDTNFDAYGMVSVTAPSYQLAVDYANTVHGDIMKMLDVALVEAA